MKIVLLALFFLFLNSEAKFLEDQLLPIDRSRTKLLPRIENKGIIKTCLACSRKFQPKLLKQLDFISLDDFRTFTPKQIGIALKCFLSFGSGIRSTLSHEVKDAKESDTKIMNCINDYGKARQISTQSMTSLYTNCQKNSLCEDWRNTVASEYELCRSDIEECETEDSIGKIVKDCVDLYPQYKADFNIDTSK